MGCDVHMYAEVRDAEGTWQLVTEPRWRDWRDRPTISPYEARNYRVFGILAGARDDGVEPISPPRGLPPDVSMGLKCPASDEPYLGDHSFTYLTLSDLLAYDWTAPMYHWGIIDLAEYRRWKASGEVWPERWNRGIWGPSYVTLREDELREPTPGESIYVRAEWQSTRADAARGFYLDVLDSLGELARARGVGPDDVRIVFGFDS